MSKLRVGIVGLGGIAQKAWLPVLTASPDWQVVAAFSPTKATALPVCDMYRIPYASSLPALASVCDAVFVHSSTRSHFAVVRELLEAGVDVCVDKPLADNLAEAEQLVALAAKKKRTLMVGFNRRFAPQYLALKQQLGSVSSLRMDKHRLNSVGPHDVRFTLLDDYLHVVDTALWLGGQQAVLQGGLLHANEQGQLLYAEHHFRRDNVLITTSMHRCAGSQREWVQAVTDGGLYDVTDMRQWREERGAGVVELPVPGWQSILEQRGFAGCAKHFIDCVANQTVPETAGEQAILAQRIIEDLLKDVISSK
ncbi:Gfo/Idh/MocA family protein [Klebsiella sp. BIGb0407]|uniref:Gfo/Idh/MocA family protein n=1 Tax=Klebsiella sp. BIGb0407 TaxID=2940603 RepID=UPI002167B599|nr:Gfo/Idh/MocA family oxidoreductase [Klebsiella sp. BIGb0407]MCS3433582.1 virulence factor [Klebsiella sp. BIGb0407]